MANLCERCLRIDETTCDCIKREDDVKAKMAICDGCPLLRKIGSRTHCEAMSDPYRHTALMWRGEVCPNGNHSTINGMVPAEHREEDFQDPFHNRPGTCLRHLADWMKKPGECDCKDWALKMDQWGSQGCRQRTGMIVAHVMSQQDHLKPWFKLPAKAGLADFGSRMMVRKAVERSEIPTAAQKAFPRPSAVPKLDCTLITACDAGFLRGAYTAIWTAMRHNSFKEVLLYDLGIGRSPMVDDMRRWGVRVVPFRKQHQGIRGWQTYAKPQMILTALTTAEKILWLDADTVTTGSLEGLTESVPSTGYIMPDHGWLKPTANENSDRFRQHLDEPNRWTGSDYPCAGVGVFDRRSASFLVEWSSRVAHVVSHNLLDDTAFYDQGCMQGIYYGERADGRVWNDLGPCRAQCSSWDGFIKAVQEREAHVLHFGGPRKPWHGWGWKNVVFGHPLQN